MPLIPDEKLESEDLDQFRKETGNSFYFPENHVVFAKIDDTFSGGGELMQRRRDDKW